MNLLVLLAGLALVLNGIYSPSEDMLNWDDQAVLTIYVFLQSSPLIFAELAGFKYFRLMRSANSRATRRAALHPRRLFDFVSPALVGLAIFTYGAFVLLVLYIRQHPFPGFVGYFNIFGLTAMNLGFAGIVVMNLYGKKRDPHQANEDRLRQIELVVNTMVLTSIVVTTFLAILFILPALELRHLTPTVMSVYLQLCAVITFRALRVSIPRQSRGL